MLCRMLVLPRLLVSRPALSCATVRWPAVTESTLLVQAGLCGNVGLAEALLQLALSCPSKRQLDTITHLVNACCQLHLDVEAAQEARCPALLHGSLICMTYCGFGD
jgi:hypothetical protein